MANLKIEKSYTVDVPYPGYIEGCAILDEMTIMECGQILFQQLFSVVFFLRKLASSKLTLVDLL
jgi:hypothetical protein